MKRTTQLERKAIDRLEVEPSINAPELGVTANHGIVVIAGKVSSGPEIYAESAAESIRLFTGLLYASAISAAFWLTVGGVAWWVGR